MTRAHPAGRLAIRIAFAFALCLAAGPARAERTRDYVIRAGDTCMLIATRELGDQAQLAAIHRLNPGLGAAPHNLVPGQILKLPVIEVAPDAQLAASRGRVEVRRAGSADWAAGTAGQDLFRTWRVGTRERSTATVRFADTSTIDMREDTVVVIFGPAAPQQPMLRTTVERGALRSRLAALDGKPRLSVTTPSGTAELTEGSAIVDVDPAGETRLSNHTGRPATLANARGRVAVKENFGSKAQRDQPPAPPRPLPPPPAWASTGELALSWRGDPPILRGAWAPVDVAVKYRVEIARAESPTVAEARLEVPATVTKVEATNLPIGDYVVTVASVDAGGFEGRPSPSLRVQMLELERPEPVTGATFNPPPGLVCRAGREAPAAGAPAGPVPLVRDDGDRAHVTCTSATGTATFEVGLPQPVITPPPPIRVKRGEPFTVELAASGVAPAAVQVSGTGVEVLAVTPAAGAVRVTLRVTADAAGSIAIAIPGQRAPALVIPVDVVAEAPPPAPRPRPGIAASMIGLVGTTVGRPDDGVLLGFEIELALRAPVGAYLGFAGRPGTSNAWATAGLLARGTGPLRPLARLGLEVDTDHTFATIGVGIERVLAPWAALRAQAEAIMSSTTAPGDAGMNLGLGLVLSR